MKKVTLYTDGACSGNPGPGGWGVILKYGKHTKELSGGFSNTTNNRMELTAVIRGLEALKEKCEVEVITDSQYVVNTMQQGWAKRWRDNGWKRNKNEKALNSDLWNKLLDLCSRHKVTFTWIRGHAGNPENQRCDQLAVAASRRNDLPQDAPAL